MRLWAWWQERKRRREQQRVEALIDVFTADLGVELYPHQRQAVIHALDPDGREVLYVAGRRGGKHTMRQVIEGVRAHEAYQAIITKEPRG